LAVKALANEKNTAVCTRDTTASAMPALAENKRHQEEAATQQRRVEDERITVLVMPPDPF
jgi:hypothetical protein